MSNELDELFGGGQGQPEPRTRLILALLLGGLLTTLLGMACSAAPGGILVLVAWVVVEKELDRVESGYLSTEFKPRLERLQQFIYAAVVVVIALFVLQFWLLRHGYYEQFWAYLIGLARGLAGT